MVHPLKHIAVRLWISIFTGGLASLLLLGLLPPGADPKGAIAATLLVIALLFVITGWLTNRIGLAMVHALVREAGIWERGEESGLAESTYRKAIAVYDGFLISPQVKKKTLGRITGRLARFYLARPDRDADRDAFLFSYLMAHPRDAEVAENWLQQPGSLSPHTRPDHDLAVRLSDAQVGNLRIQLALAQFFLKAKRTDFQALQTYRRVLDGTNSRETDTLAAGVADLFLAQRRADELSLEVYFRALRGRNNQQQLLRGIAACVHWVGKNDRTTPLLRKARQLLIRVGIEITADMVAGFAPAAVSPAQAGSSHRRGSLRVLHRSVDRACRRLWGKTRRLVPRAARQATAALTRVRHSRRSQAVLKYALISTLTVGVVLLVVNTAIHLIASRPARENGPKPETVAMPVVTDPFTLQVAAYRKPEHAAKYVALLKKQALDVYTVVAKGPGKTWYQVRISHFPTKDAAKTYGNALKTAGLVDDYYIANYEPPP